jgi:hypothetical protein
MAGSSPGMTSFYNIPGLNNLRYRWLLAPDIMNSPSPRYWIVLGTLWRGRDMRFDHFEGEQVVLFH